MLWCSLSVLCAEERSGAAKEDAFRNTLNKEIRVAKRSYAKKLENQFSSNDPASVWKGLRDITNYKTPSPSTEDNQQLAEDLNEFYCRFETAGLTPHAPSEHLSIQPLTPPATPLSPPPALRISEDDVCQIFLKQKRRKAPGPDSVTPACLKTCADQLAFIFSQIFNRSLELCEVPACFKRSTIIPIPKKPKITGLNDYRPVALTSVVMKSFERLVLAYLKNITGPLLDPLQFAYRANRSVDDAVNMGLHFILQHLDKSGTYVRLLSVDFSSAFNTIIPTLLQTKLTQLSVPSSICQWITSFLTDRHQLVKLGKFTSYSRTTSTGAPQGCVLSPLLFSLYTNDCTSTDPSVKLLKFADNTTVIGLIQDSDESAYRQEIEQLAAWCSLNNLELNTLKTVEMIVDFRRNTPLTIMNSTVPTVESFRFLGTTISQDLKWDNHIDSIIKKVQQRLYFLLQLRKFNLPQELLTHFYSAVIESVLCTSITVWFGSATKSDIRRVQRTVRTAERIIGVPLPTLQELVLEGSWEFAQPVHMCFVDLEKAFDCVPRGILWEVLWEYGVRGPLLRAVRSLYNRSRSLVRIASCLDLQHALGRFAAECEAAGMRVSTSKSETMVLDRKKVACTLQVGGEVLPQVEEFKYLGVLFTSEGRMDRKIDRRISAAAAVMRSMYRSVVVKKELSRKVKLSIYQSIYVPTLTYGHELWVMTERCSITPDGRSSPRLGVK
ncbi:hypothetical protein QTP70_010415 [Hemibagrus guttatus]|uniref:Reverse transcriptase domain-containing protein n=1 Tax=Hemibagrus guttatus TaxID=175788 RepID=A0AAE0V6F5_9TELE|nr:hypothetical protein QTP70_010415 [Hemibagrus guttatus]